MPTTKYDPTKDFDPVQEDYGYGSGKSLLLADYGAEKFEEGETRAKDIETAGRARSVEQERKSLLSLLGGAVGLAFFGPAGMLIGYGAGKAAGGLGTYGGKAVEDYMVSEDVGMFDVEEKYELQDINKDLVAADKADFWGDVMDIGKVGALSFSMGGGSFADPGNFSPWQIGGKEAAAEGMYGTGLFKTPAGEWGTGAGTLWGRYTGKPSIFELKPQENVEAMRGSRARSGGIV
jgi:hypothetical protein